MRPVYAVAALALASSSSIASAQLHLGQTLAVAATRSGWVKTVFAYLA